MNEPHIKLDDVIIQYEDQASNDKIPIHQRTLYKRRVQVAKILMEHPLGEDNGPQNLSLDLIAEKLAENGISSISIENLKKDLKGIGSEIGIDYGFKIDRDTRKVLIYQR